MKRVKLMAMIAAVVLVLAVAVVSQSTSQSERSVSSEFFGGEKAANNRVTHENRYVAFDFEDVEDTVEDGSYIFDGVITAKESGSWDIIILTPVDFDAQLGVWEHATRQRVVETCEQVYDFTYENGTEVWDTVCSEEVVEETGYGWTYYRPTKREPEALDGKYAIYFEDIPMTADVATSVLVKVDRGSVPRYQTIKFDVVAIPVGNTLQSARALGIGGAVDPVIDPAEDEIARWPLSSTYNDSQNNYDLTPNGGLTFVSDVIGSTDVNVLNLDGTGGTYLRITDNAFTGATSHSVALWIKDGGNGEYLIGNGAAKRMGGI